MRESARGGRKASVGKKDCQRRTNPLGWLRSHSEERMRMTY